MHTGGFGTDEIQWRRWANLSVDTTASTEVGAVTMLDMDQDEITTKLQIYKAGIEFSEVIHTAGIDNVFAAMIEKLGQRAGRQAHKILIAALEGGVGATSTWAGGANVTYGGSATSVGTLAAGDKISSQVLLRVQREFERRDVDPFPDGTFHVVCHPDQIYDLRQDPRWEKLAYEGAGVGGNGNVWSAGQIGRIFGFTFLVTTDMTQLNTGGTGGNVPYAKAFAYGPDAFGCYDFAAMTLNAPNEKTNLGIKLFHELPGKSSKSDLTGDYGYVAYKFAFAAKVIDPDRIQGVYTATSA